MKILITGGGGFVGRNLARTLPHFGYEVLAPNHKKLDMTNVEDFIKYLESHNPEAVIHTAFSGHFGKPNADYESFINNLKMMDVLYHAENYYRLRRPTIIIGSGAEFDRRYDISNFSEDALFSSWPIDYYGLAKNMISRRALSGDLDNPFILRLFGCFGSDEPDFRFIKQSILNLKEGNPIIIKKNREMDFFFVDDVAKVINHVLLTNHYEFRNMNLVYESQIQQKPTLRDIGEIICQTMNVPLNIEIKSSEKELSYTGDGTLLNTYIKNLAGLHGGIYRMVKDLT